jgi:hypothetical protein
VIHCEPKTDYPIIAQKQGNFNKIVETSEIFIDASSRTGLGKLTKEWNFRF